MKAVTLCEVYATSGEDRQRCGHDYIVAVSKELAKSHDLNNVLEIVVERPSNGDQPALRVSASLRVDSNLETLATREYSKIRMDQTLRTALGLPFTRDSIKAKLDLQIFPLQTNKLKWLKQRLLNILGVKYIYARVEKPDPTDIEKNICRISKDALAIIGTDEGRRVVILACRRESESHVPCPTEIAIRAFDLKQTHRSEPDSHDKEGWGARYVNFSKLLGVSPDLSPIYLDEHARAALGVVPGQAVRVRRDLIDLYKSQAFEFAVVMGLSAPAGKLLPEAFQKNDFWVWAIVSIILSMIFALLIVAVRLRSRVR